jgi:tetratricopeptide (TPR) repeat protein
MLGASGTWILAWVILTLVVHAPSSASAFRNIEKGKPCLDFSLKDLGGSTVSLADFKGKGLVICFWSAEKENAVKSMEILQELYGAYKEKGLAVVGINTDQGAEAKVKEVVAAKGITFPILLDGTRETYGKYGVFIIPTMGLCDKSGNLQEPFSFSMHMKPELEGQIKILLGLATAEAVSQSLAVSTTPALGADEKSVERHVGLAQTLLGQKMYDKALVELETAVKIKADDAPLQITLGKTLLLLGRPADAKTAFEKARTVNPMSRDAKEGLGEALVGTGEYDKALELLTEALLLNPRPAAVHYRIGRVHEAKGDLKAAVESYKKALSLLLGE